MPQTEPQRQWFVSGEGIDRHVISSDIQRYLGNDATVRPGPGTGEQSGVQGYWIRAYRNLTSAMIEDLRADSARWRQEQHATGTREPYVGSSTYNTSSARAPISRRDADSPSVDGPYGLPTSRAERSRVSVDTPMQIDGPAPPPSNRGYPQDRGYQPENRPYAQDHRGFAPESRGPFQQDMNVNSIGFGSARPPPASSPYGQPEGARYNPGYGPPQNEGPSAGFPRQGYYVPTSGYEPAPAMPRTADAYGNTPYGQPPPGRDPRYQQQDYPDSRYNAYPSPANSIVPPVTSRDPPRGDPISSPAQASTYGSMPSSANYDQYGARPVQALAGQIPGVPIAAYGRPPSTGSTQDRRMRRS